MNWTRIPAAAELLASLSANPPRQIYVTGTFGPNDGAMILSGSDDRMKALRLIWEDEQSRLLKLADQSKDYTAFNAHCSLTVEEGVKLVREQRLGRCPQAGRSAGLRPEPLRVSALRAPHANARKRA